MSFGALHVARTGLDAQSFRMQVIANNLANVNTTGFKRDRANFETLSYQMITQPGATAAADNRYATGLNLGTGVQLSGTSRIDTQGTFATRSEEHTSELQSLMRISYAVFCLKKKNTNRITELGKIETKDTCER